MKDIPLLTQILVVLGSIVLIGVLWPMMSHVIRSIRVSCHPLMLPYKHVLITGAGSGLGKALVSEIYQRGAYITMIGKDGEIL